MKTATGKIIKWVAIVFVIYAGIVVLYESLIGYFQPQHESTVVITTTTSDGASHDRVLSLLESNGQLYVSANHWPRAWYNNALANPEVLLTLEGEQGEYRAVPVTGGEREHLSEEHGASPMMRLMTGFAPRRFLRLDPVDEG